jgi:hypothetical protein
MTGGLQMGHSAYATGSPDRPPPTRIEAMGAPRGCRGGRGWLLIGISVLAMLAGIWPSSAKANAVLHVDEALGSDTGNCQLTSCKTVGYAVEQAALVGEPVTIDAAAGTYSENLTLSSVVSGLTIVGAGSGSDPASTIISGTGGASTIECADVASLTLEHLQVLNPEGDNEDAIEAPEANLSLTDVTVEQLAGSGFADGINAGGIGPASVTLNGGSVHIAGTESEGYAINNRGGPITVTGARITVEGSGYGLNAINGVISATNTTINITDPESSGYAINTYADIYTTNATITIAGSGLAVNDVDESTLENTTITLTNSEEKGYGVNSDAGITASNDTISLAGSDTGLNTTGNLTIINSTVALSNVESTEAVFAAGAVKAAGDHITNAGHGCGIFAGKAMTLNDTSVEMTNPNANVCGVFTGKDLEGEGDEITIAGEGDGEGIGCGGSLNLTDSTILLSGPMGEAWGIRASNSANLERVTVTSTLASALFVANGPSVVTDSTLMNTGGEPTVSLSGEGTALIRRSTVRMQAASGIPVIAIEGIGLVLENSLVLGGSGILFQADGGETDTLTVASSTIDAGQLGVRDENVNSITAIIDKNRVSSAVVNIEASLLVEPPAATIPAKAVATVAVAPPTTGSGTVTVHCSNTEVPGVSQAASGLLGAIECATGSDGNTFTESVADIFAHPGASYVLNPAWDGVDSVPAGAVTLPGGLNPSSTDLVGDPRVLNGVGSCLPGLQDKGALELTGHEGIVPDPVVSGPESATAGAPVQFTATTGNVPEATYEWESSDGALADGSTFIHTFQTAGSYTVKLTATGGKGCVAKSTKKIDANPKPEPVLEPKGRPAPEAKGEAKPDEALEAKPQPYVPVTAAQLALVCANRRLTLTDVVMEKDHVLLTGAAEGGLIGRTIAIVFDGGEEVATAKVARNGLFAATAPLPPKSLRYSNRARYEARVGKLRSLNLKLTRRLILDPPKSHRGKVTLTGEVLAPLARPRASVVISEEGSNCKRTTVVAHIKPKANGRYEITLGIPTGRSAVVYRLSSAVRADTHSSKTFRTYSLTEAVQPG